MIFENGLTRPSKRNADVLPGHIPKTATIANIKEFADAIFFSPSIFYSALG